MDKFSLSFFHILLLVPLHYIYLAEKNLGIANWPIEVKKQYVLPDNCHTQKRTYSLNTHP